MFGVGIPELIVIFILIVVIMIGFKGFGLLRGFVSKEESFSTMRGDATRYLTASALLQGSSFRKKWLDYVKNSHSALAPELGVDVPLLIKVCKNLENRETRYQACFFAISMVYLFILFFTGIESYFDEEIFITITLIFFVIAWLLRSYKGHAEHTLAITFFQEDKYDSQAISKKLVTFKSVGLKKNLEKNHGLLHSLYGHI